MNATPSAQTVGPHGGDGIRLAREVGADPATIVDLSASLNPFAPDVTGVVRALLDREPHALNAYPDPTTATDLLASAMGVDSGRLVLTNGGAEAIALVASIEERGAVVAPEFSLYERHLGTLSDDAPRWRSNPSNPLGELAAGDESARVWDEAFYPVSTGRWTRGDDESWRLGSLTKLWACPGLRLGYVIAPDSAAADDVQARQPRWAVNGLGLGAIPPLLALTDLESWAAAIARARDEFATALRAAGYTVRDTQANWLLVDHDDDLRYSMARNGVAIRDCSSFGLAGVFRVALPRLEHLERVLDAFARVALQS